MKNFTDNLDRVSRAAEEVGAAFEYRRVVAAIEALPTLNTDEHDYRERVLEAIQATTATGPAGLSRGPASPRRAEGISAVPATAAAAAQQGAFGTSSG